MADIQVVRGPSVEVPPELESLFKRALERHPNPLDCWKGLPH